MAEIKKLISSAYYNYKKDAVILEQIKDKNLVGYFLDNNNFNSELFKRSLVVLEYAYKSNLFTKEHFCLVLKYFLSYIIDSTRTSMNCNCKVSTTVWRSLGHF